MYRNGHYGMALLLYVPLGVALVVAGWRGLALIGGAVTVALATLPDLDHRLPLVSHRGPTHTLAFAVLVGLCVAAGGRFAASTLPYAVSTLTAVGFVVGSLAVVSHLLADVVTPTGISPFWPLSGRRYTFSLVRADNWVANQALLAIGVFVTAVAVVVLGQ